MHLTLAGPIGLKATYLPHQHHHTCNQLSPCKRNLKVDYVTCK